MCDGIFYSILTWFELEVEGEMEKDKYSNIKYCIEFTWKTNIKITDCLPLALYFLHEP